MENAKLQFIKKYREAVFLFGESSDVYKVLSEFKTVIIFDINFEDRFLNKEYSAEDHVAWDKIRSTMRDASEILLDLERALQQWIGFEKIT